MVVLSAGTLVSDCCHVLALCGDASCSFYQCSQCNQICPASESLGEYHERLKAPKRELERLEREVIEKTRAWRHVNPIDRAMRNHEIIEAVDALEKFEAENKVE